MTHWKAMVGVAVLAAALPLTGCAAIFGGYDVAPNGLPVAEDALRRDLAARPGVAYTTVIGGSRDLPGDDLLRLLYAGTAGRYAGEYHEGARLLDLASYVAEDRVTTSVSREALSLVTSDRALSYVPGTTERMMIPYLAAATYLEAGDLGAAAVEARRIEALLDRLSDTDRADDNRSRETRRFLHLYAAAIFEAAGEASAAEVAYRRAGVPDVVESDSAAIETDSVASDQAASRSTGEVVVLVESGFVPHQVEQSVAIALPSWQVSRLTDGSLADKAVAATEAAARVMLTANQLYGDRRGYYGDRGYRQPAWLSPWDGEECPDGEDEECSSDTDALPYLMRISWPVLYQESDDVPVLAVRAGDVAGEPLTHLDVAGGARQDFEDRRGTMIARTMLRAASKVALSSAAQSAAEKKEEGAGEVVGILANVGNFLTERADTRCWHLLPGRVSMIRLELPAGTHDLALELDGGEEGGRTLSLGSVRVEAGRTAFVTHRIWR